MTSITDMTTCELAGGDVFVCGAVVCDGTEC